MSTTQSGDREVVTVVSIIEDTDGSATGHVVLGVLGSLAFVFFLVIILVPIIRWRKRRGSARGSSTTESRASSRRTHTRIVSEYHRDAAAPLLEEQPTTTTGGGMAAVHMNAPMVTQPLQGVLSDQGRRTTPSRPPTALLSMKILQTLPNFDEEDESNSSLGRPLEPDERTFPQATDTSVRLVTDADRRSAALPPIPVPEQPSRNSTFVSTSPPTSPLTNAFQRPPSTAPSESTSITNSPSTFRYPSLVSSSSKSSVPTSTALSTPRNTAYTPSPSWMPKSLVPGTGSPVQSETWWRTPSMPPIPESVRSASLSSVQQHGGPETTTKTKRDSSSPPPTAVLRDTSAEAGPSAIHHVRHLSGEATTTTTLGSLSRSSTQHTSTDRSNKASFVERDERRVSTLTHGTFGRQGHADSREASHTRGTTESEEGGVVVPPASPTERTIKHMKRRTLDYPREPSPPLTVAPLSAPPPLYSHSTRSSSIQHQPPYRSTTTTTTTTGRPSSGPIPDPQSPQDNEPDPPSPEVQLASPYAYEYGHNEEASSSSEQLLPQDSVPLLPELPSLPQLSPLAFEFKLESAGASRSNSASTGRGSSRRSGKSNKSNNSSIGRGKGKGEGKGHVKSPSKASSISAYSANSGTGSKRSLRSLASFSSSSLRSRSKSRERERGERGGDRDRVKHVRRVTFGDTSETPPPVPDRTPTPTHTPVHTRTHTPTSTGNSGNVGGNGSRASTPAEQSQSRQDSPVPTPGPGLLPQKRPSRPLPMLPATLIAGYSMPLPGQAAGTGGPGPGPQQGRGNGNGGGGYVVH